MSTSYSGLCDGVSLVELRNVDKDVIVIFHPDGTDSAFQGSLQCEESALPSLLRLFFPGREVARTFATGSVKTAITVNLENPSLSMQLLSEYGTLTTLEQLLAGCFKG